jgi:hypothetical protein
LGTGTLKGSCFVSFRNFLFDIFSIICMLYGAYPHDL